jgi:hypothetical protein
VCQFAEWADVGFNGTMSEISGTPLPRRFVLYFPMGCSGGDLLGSTVEGILCERLGGVTSYPAKGTFRMADGQRSSDHLQVLESFCESRDWEKQKPFLISLAGIIGAILKQESIACAIDGRMKIVRSSVGEEVPALDRYPARNWEKVLTDHVLQHLASGLDPAGPLEGGAPGARGVVG